MPRFLLFFFCLVTVDSYAVTKYCADGSYAAEVKLPWETRFECKDGSTPSPVPPAPKKKNNDALAEKNLDESIVSNANPSNDHEELLVFFFRSLFQIDGFEQYGVRIGIDIFSCKPYAPEQEVLDLFLKPDLRNISVGYLKRSKRCKIAEKTFLIGLPLYFDNPNYKYPCRIQFEEHDKFRKIEPAPSENFVNGCVMDIRKGAPDRDGSALLTFTGLRVTVLDETKTYSGNMKIKVNAQTKKIIEEALHFDEILTPEEL